MAFVVITFALVLLIVIGGYWFFIVRPEEETRTKLVRRLGRVSKTKSVALDLLKPLQRMSAIGPLENVFALLKGWIEPLNVTIQQSGLKTNVGTVLLATGCAAVLTFQAVLFFTHYAVIALLFALIGGAMPIFYVRHKRNKRLIKLEEQFPEAIDLLARALRAGHALTTGLAMVAEELADPMGGEFRQLYDQQNFGMPMPEALKEFATRVPSLDAKFFVTAVLTQREAGGNLSEVLDNLATIIRDRFRVKRQVRVISAHGRITGWVLACLPPGLAIGFTILTPDSYKMFYRDPLGIKMIFFAILLQIMGVLVIRRIVDIEY